MSKSLKISVIIPIYNAQATLEKCLQSVLAQTLEDIEIICVNDGSTDKSLAILKTYEDKFPHKIQVIHQMNEGVWRARRRGIKASKGSYIAFLDSDDEAAPQWLEKLHQEAITTQADMTVCAYERVAIGERVIKHAEMTQFGQATFNLRENPDLLVAVNTALWNKLFKSELLKNMSDLKHPPRVLEDVMFLLLVFLDIETVSFVPEVLYTYYVRTGTAMMTINEQDIAAVERGFLEVNKIFHEKEASLDLQTVLAIKAFFHMGASMGYRLRTKDIQANKAFQKRIRHYLNTQFKSWQKNHILGLPHILKTAPYNKKLWVIQKVYKYHGIPLFMKCYSKMNVRQVRW